jgi:hypothetical protein
VAENDSFQKVEFSLEQTFKGRFYQMAAVRRKMGLDMGHLEGRSHKTEGKGTRRMDEFFRNIGTKKTDWNTVLGEVRGHLPISFGSNSLEFLKNFREGGFFIH